MNVNDIEKIASIMKKYNISIIKTNELEIHASQNNINNNKHIENNSVTDNKVKEEENNLLHKILSPTMGTVYVAGTPGGNPYIKINQKINKGDTLFLVEVMKHITEITSDVSGIVRNIYVKNEESVERGALLVEIEKNV